MEGDPQTAQTPAPAFKNVWSLLSRSAQFATTPEALSTPPEKVRSISPADYAILERLSAYERAVDEGLKRQQWMLGETCASLNIVAAETLHREGLEDPGLASACAELANLQRRHFRLSVSNTSHNQRQSNGDLETTSCRDWSRTPPASWTLKVFGTLLPVREPSGLQPGSEDVDDISGGSHPCNCTFTCLFHRVMVVTKDETILWDRQQHLSELGMASGRGVFGEAAATFAAPNSLEGCRFCGCRAAWGGIERAEGNESSLPLDGLEINRAGEDEHDIKVVVFPDFKCPTFALPPALAQIVGAPVATMPVCILAIIRRAKSMKLFTADTGREISCDPLFQEIFGVKEVSLGDLPALLRKKLTFPKPVTIVHHLKLRGDCLENETQCDIAVYLPCHFPHEADIAPWLGTVLPSPLNSVPGPLSLLTPRQEDRLQTLDSNLELVASGLAKTRNQIMKLETRLLELLDERNMYETFANDPAKTTDQLLRAHHFPAQYVIQSKGAPFRIPPSSLHDEKFLEEYASAEHCADFYRQPWVRGAISYYLKNRGRSVDDQISQTALAFATERKRARRIGRLRQGLLGTTAQDGADENSSKRQRPMTDGGLRLKKVGEPATTRSDFRATC